VHKCALVQQCFLQHSADNRHPVQHLRQLGPTKDHGTNKHAAAAGQAHTSHTNVSLCNNAICSTWLVFHSPCSNSGINRFPPLRRYKQSQVAPSTSSGRKLWGLKCSAAKLRALRPTQAGMGRTLVRAVRKKPRQNTCSVAQHYHQQEAKCCIAVLAPALPPPQKTHTQPYTV
jgi:hypothetical protein